jgi:AcrR family transcriptional regulator
MNAASDRKPRTREQMKAETRDALLNAGAELLRENGPVGEVRHQVHAQAVAKRAGKSTGAFYEHFDSQADFVAELIPWVLDAERYRRLQAETVDFVDQMASVNVHLEDLIRGGAAKNLADIADDPYFVIQIGMVARSEQDDEVRALLAKMYRDLNESYVGLYRRVLAGYGRRFRRGYSAEQLAVVLNAVVEGLAMRRLIDPDAVTPDDEGRDLFGDAAWHIAMGMTEEDQ